MEKIIETYRRDYQKKRTMYLILVFFSLGIWAYTGFQLLHNRGWLLPWLFLIFLYSFIMRLIRNVIFSRLAYQAIAKPYEAGDILVAYEISKAISNIVARYATGYVWINHMTILCNMGRFDELQQFYQLHRKAIQRYVHPAMLEREFLIFSAYAQQTDKCYEEWYRRFLKRTQKTMKRVPQMKQQRLQFQIEYAITLHQYEEALKLLEAYTISTANTAVYAHYHRALCLWKLNRKEEASSSIEAGLKYSEAYINVRRIKALKEGYESKEFMSSAFLQEAAGDITKQNKRGARRKWIFNGVMIFFILLLLFVFSVSSFRKHPYTSMIQAVNEVSDRVGEKAYLQFDFDEFHVGLVKTRGEATDNEDTIQALALGIPVYYVISVQVMDESIASLTMNGGAFTFNDSRIHCFPIKHREDVTYVLLAGEYQQISYKGNILQDIKTTKLKESGKKTDYTLNAFLIYDKAFDEDQINVVR